MEFIGGLPPLKKDSKVYSFLTRLQTSQNQNDINMLIPQIHTIQKFLSKYVFTKDQHIAFELAA